MDGAWSEQHSLALDASNPRVFVALNNRKAGSLAKALHRADAQPCSPKMRRF